MDKLTKLNLKFPNDKFGSSKYTLQLEITNISDEKIFIDEIDADIIPGVIISKNQTDSISELTTLEYEKKEIVEELEFQLDRAYDKQKFSKLDFIPRILIFYFTIPELIAASLTKTKPEMSFPNWAKKAFTIKEWEDVIQLEETLMSKEKDDSLLKKAFQINKSKLEKILSKLSVAKEYSDVNLSYSYTLNPKETIVIPYHCRAPHLYKESQFDLLINLKYRTPNNQNIFNQAISDTIKFKSSSFAVPLGACLGGIFGFLIRLIFISKGDFFDYNFWRVLLGSILISLVLGVIMNNSSESKKIVTVEGFTGGLIIGAITSLFTENIIEYLEKFIPR
jgi:hypothetical protein